MSGFFQLSPSLGEGAVGCRVLAGWFDGKPGPRGPGLDLVVSPFRKAGRGTSMREYDQGGVPGATLGQDLGMPAAEWGCMRGAESVEVT